MDEKYYYEKMDENYKRKGCPFSDYDGSITGHIVFGLRAWFDEHPEERKRLGWIKHIMQDQKEIKYNTHTQYLVKSIVQIDEYTVKDVYHVMDKTEEMYLLEDLLPGTRGGNNGVSVFWGGDFDEFVP